MKGARQKPSVFARNLTCILFVTKIDLYTILLSFGVGGDRSGG